MYIECVLSGLMLYAEIRIGWKSGLEVFQIISPALARQVAALPPTGKKWESYLLRMINKRVAEVVRPVLDRTMGLSEQDEVNMHTESFSPFPTQLSEYQPQAIMLWAGGWWSSQGPLNRLGGETWRHWHQGSAARGPRTHRPPTHSASIRHCSVQLSVGNLQRLDEPEQSL